MVEEGEFSLNQMQVHSRNNLNNNTACHEKKKHFKKSILHTPSQTWEYKNQNI